ncbi:ABC transporter permease subunit [Cohnella faecalis]|uniref:ABC transporter permease subunit n=1 Tax=Cohnella faecalis TaxID=2315694 RepID=UPI0022790AC5|nr:hypothetical protein [Cohnella faecalis]
MDMWMQMIVAAVASGTPLLFATLGGILIERSGIIQLGAEGLMLMGAVIACLTYLNTGSLTAAILVVIAVSVALGLLHAFVTVTLRANQIVSGLAMTLLGAGLSAYMASRSAVCHCPARFRNGICLGWSPFRLSAIFSLIWMYSPGQALRLLRPCTFTFTARRRGCI